MPRLVDWAIVQGEGSADARALTGVIYDHPEIPDGTELTTHSILMAEGTLITFYQGGNCQLDGPPCKSYLGFLKRRGITYDPADPLQWSKLK